MAHMNGKGDGQFLGFWVRVGSRKGSGNYWVCIWRGVRMFFLWGLGKYYSGTWTLGVRYEAHKA